MKIAPVTVQKNAREELRLSIDEYRSRLLLSCRLWFTPSEGGDRRPSREGWAVVIEKPPEIVSGLQRLQDESRAAGLLAGGSNGAQRARRYRQRKRDRVPGTEGINPADHSGSREPARDVARDAGVTGRDGPAIASLFGDDLPARKAG